MTEIIPTAKIFNMPEYTDTVSDQIRIITERRIKMIVDIDRAKFPGVRILRDAYQTLFDLGLLNFRDLTLEYIKIKNKTSTLSARERAWIVNFINNCILLTLEIERPSDNKLKTKSK